MSDYVTPCARPENDPEDWFLERDGRQYADDGSLEPTEDEFEEALLLETDEEARAFLDGIRADNLREALRRRRHAKDKCFTECYLRVQCLSVAMETRPVSGTWGGYHFEELRRIWAVLDERGSVD